MILRSNTIGEIEVADDSVLFFPDGLVGFAELNHYILAEVEEFHPFLWLLSVDEPDIGFAIADPQLFYSGRYEVTLSEADKDVLDLQSGDTVSVFVVVSIADAGKRITANLKGPVVLNTRNRLCKQLVVYSPSYSIRQNMLSLEQEGVPVAEIAAAGRIRDRARPAIRG
jgi:flagellar assembly factor FliW